LQLQGSKPQSSVLNITLRFKLKSLYKIMSIFLQSAGPARPISLVKYPSTDPEGGAGGARPSREKSAYLCGVHFGTVFRPNTPNFRGSLRSPNRARGGPYRGDAPLPENFFLDLCLKVTSFDQLIGFRMGSKGGRGAPRLN